MTPARPLASQSLSFLIGEVGEGLLTQIQGDHNAWCTRQISSVYSVPGPGDTVVNMAVIIPRSGAPSLVAEAGEEPGAQAVVGLLGSTEERSQKGVCLS